MKKETLLHSKKIQKMITQYKHDMQLVDQLTADAAPHYEIEQELYVKHEVKRGLRDLDGKGVRAGLTTISKVSATQMVDGREVPAPGQLLYRGIPIEELRRKLFSFFFCTEYAIRHFECIVSADSYNTNSRRSRTRQSSRYAFSLYS